MAEANTRRTKGHHLRVDTRSSNRAVKSRRVHPSSKDGQRTSPNRTQDEGESHPFLRRIPLSSALVDYINHDMSQSPLFVRKSSMEDLESSMHDDLRGAAASNGPGGSNRRLRSLSPAKLPRPRRVGRTPSTTPMIGSASTLDYPISRGNRREDVMEASVQSLNDVELGSASEGSLIEQFGTLPPRGGSFVAEGRNNSWVGEVDPHRARSFSSGSAADDFGTPSRTLPPRDESFVVEGRNNSWVGEVDPHRARSFSSDGGGSGAAGDFETPSRTRRYTVDGEENVSHSLSFPQQQRRKCSADVALNSSFPRPPRRRNSPRKYSDDLVRAMRKYSEEWGRVGNNSRTDSSSRRASTARKYIEELGVSSVSGNRSRKYSEDSSEGRVSTARKYIEEELGVDNKARTYSEELAPPPNPPPYHSTPPQRRSPQRRRSFDKNVDYLAVVGTPAPSVEDDDDRPYDEMLIKDDGPGDNPLNYSMDRSDEGFSDEGFTGEFGEFRKRQNSLRSQGRQTAFMVEGGSDFVDVEAPDRVGSDYLTEDGASLPTPEVLCKDMSIASAMRLSEERHPQQQQQQQHQQKQEQFDDEDEVVVVQQRQDLPPPPTPQPYNTTDRRLSDVDRHIVWLLLDYLRYRSWKKKLMTIVVIASVVLVFIDFFTFGWIRGGLMNFMSWMKGHSIAGVFAFIGLFVFTTLVFIPPSILTFGSGFVFADVYGMGPGIVLATVACFVGSALGAVIAFFRARYMMRDLVKLFAKKYPVVRAADRAIKSDGFRVMLLLRLCPLIPFNALNYIGGITGVRWEAYTLALIGILPAMLLTVAIGATANGLAVEQGNEDQRRARKIGIIVGCVFGAVAIVITWFFARRELHRELERNPTEGKEMASTSRAEDHEDDLSVVATISDEQQEYQEGIDDEEWFWIWT